MTSRRRRVLATGWEVGEAAPGAEPTEWLPVDRPSTAAAALAQHRRWDFTRPKDFDASDWWFRCRFATTPSEGRQILSFGGLATLAEVALNGAPLLTSDNMFVEHEVEVTDRLRATNELVIRCRSLGQALMVRRPRPRWKTKLVSHQQLRWFRTTLLGRVPGWSPPVAPVGPWRPVVLEERCGIEVGEVDVRTASDGTVHVRLWTTATAATLTVGDVRAELRAEDGWLVGELRVPNVALWWPHTHGAQPRYPVTIQIADEIIDCGQVGFRSIAAGPIDGAFSVHVNGEVVFCRGACWSASDIVTLTAEPAKLRAELELLRAAGMNMVRIGGTMVYGDDDFYDLCDELGLLVWQDFMFANMDYPEDESFVAGVRREARDLLRRLQGRPSLAVLCGSSEIEQQVAMLGLPKEMWSSPLFQTVLPGVARELVPEVPYVPSSPCGGPLPFHPDVGVSHYYGVGAYLRPLEDARRAGVKFTSECLAFSNIPTTTTIESFLADGEAPGHHPRWKERIPRDVGPGWDFEDVRDYYVGQLFGVDPMRLRYADVERYLELGRVTTGLVMAQTFAEWRRTGSSCTGGLIWFWKDLWPGAGWGLVDALGQPKAAYYLAKQSLAPVALLLTDEGLSGPVLHAINEGPTPFEALLEIRLWRQGRIEVARGARQLDLPARGQLALSADTLFERFLDLSWAYRFGPPGYDALVATLTVAGRLVDEIGFWPCGWPKDREPDLGLRATAHGAELELTTERLAACVAIELVDDLLPEENYLWIEPGRPRRVRLLGHSAPDRAIRGEIRALNGHATARIM